MPKDKGVRGEDPSDLHDYAKSLHRQVTSRMFPSIETR